MRISDWSSDVCSSDLISAIAGAIEILVGILRTRAPGMTLDKMPLFAWAMLVFAVMIIIAFPAVILGTLLLELERALNRSEEHTSELQSLMRISYAVFCLKKKKNKLRHQ